MSKEGTLAWHGSKEMNKQAKINQLKSETDGSKILVINPNSTSTMTDKIAKFVESH